AQASHPGDRAGVGAQDADPRGVLAHEVPRALPGLDDTFHGEQPQGGAGDLFADPVVAGEAGSGRQACAGDQLTAQDRAPELVGEPDVAWLPLHGSGVPGGRRNGRGCDSVVIQVWVVGSEPARSPKLAHVPSKAAKNPGRSPYSRVIGPVPLWAADSAPSGDASDLRMHREPQGSPKSRET